MSIYDNKNAEFDIHPSVVTLSEIFSDDSAANLNSQKEAIAPTNIPTELTQQFTPDEINSVLPSFSQNSSQIDDDFIDLEPPTPTAGTRLSIKIVNCRQEANQPTNYGLKTVASIDIDCFCEDGQIYRVTERFYRNPGDPISGRFKSFCADLFKAFDLKRVRLSDLIGRECTAIITYTLDKDGITKWPHLSNFEPLSQYLK